jgi:hypothetical protein
MDNTAVQNDNHQYKSPADGGLIKAAVDPPAGNACLSG